VLCAIKTVGKQRKKSATAKTATGDGERTTGTVSRPTPSARDITRGWLALLIFLTVTLIAYLPALNGGLIWDDDAHLTSPELRSFHGLVEIWTHPEVTQQYYPLVHSAFWLEHKLWGDRPLPYHLVNIFLHAISAVILLRILRRLRVPGAWLAAGLFALHPVQVETVAWISELKNTLSGAFFLSAALLYIRFDETRRRSFYFLALALFVLGLFCKSVIATLPAALLIVFWWQRGKLSLKRDSWPLLPFFIVGMAAGSFTAWVERTYIGAQGVEFNFSLIERCLIAGRAFWFYLSKLFWPRDLIFIYPRWQVSQTVWWQYLFPFAALLLLVLLWAWRRKQRAPLAGLLLFFGMLFPALGFFNVYPFVYSFVADHFQYLASIGIFALIGAALTLLFGLRGNRYRKLGIVTSLLLLTVLFALTYRQSRMYASTETLYRATLHKNPDCWMAHDNLGVILVSNGQLDEAIDHYHEALKLRPSNPQTHYDLGIALRRKGQTDAAIREYKEALQLRPNYQKAHNNLGNLLFQDGKIDEAVSHLRQALELQSDYAEAHNNLGNALMQKRMVDEAISHYEKALEIRSQYREAHFNLAGALVEVGRLDEGIGHYREAMKGGSNPPEAYLGLGDALRKKGLIDEALVQFRTALATAVSQGNDSLATLIKTEIAQMRAQHPVRPQ
jgi:Flp pilus assembly protein TadD